MVAGGIWVLSPRSVVVTVSAIENMPLHIATYEVWLNGKQIDSKDTADGFFVTTIKVSIWHSNTIEGRVKYKNGFGVVMDEQRVRDYLTMFESRHIKLEVR